MPLALLRLNVGRSMARRGWLWMGVAYPLVGCNSPLDLGTDIVWSTDYETGDLSAWTAAPGEGGSYPGAGVSTMTISSERAHSGRYSLNVTSTTTNPQPAPYAPGGGAVFKVADFPQDAFYSAWYFLPHAFPGIANWNIVRFGSSVLPPAGNGNAVSPADAGDTGTTQTSDSGASSRGGDAGAGTMVQGRSDYYQLFDVRLRSQPSGDMTVVLYDHRREYGEERMPLQVPVVPIGIWFQVEVFYRNVPDATGRVSIWLDGTQIYDVARPMTSSSSVYFTACSLVEDPGSTQIFIDDVAVSWRQVTPQGVLKLSAAPSLFLPVAAAADSRPELRRKARNLAGAGDP